MRITPITLLLLITMLLIEGLVLGVIFVALVTVFHMIMKLALEIKIIVQTEPHRGFFLIIENIVRFSYYIKKGSAPTFAKLIPLSVFPSQLKV